MKKRSLKFIYLSLIFVGLGTWNLGLLSSGSSSPAEKIIITAKNQTFDLKNKVLTAWGEVNINYKDFFIQTEKVVFHQEKEELALPAKFNFKSKDVKLTGSSAQINLKNKEMKAVGAINLETKDVKMKGEIVNFNYETNRVHLSQNCQTLYQKSGKETQISAQEILYLPEEKKIESQGRVEIKQESIEAQAERAILYPEEEKIELKGKAKVHQDKNRLTADMMVLLFKENRILLEGDTEIIVLPKME